MKDEEKESIDQDSRVQIHKIHAIADVIARIFSETAKWGTIIFAIWMFSDVLKEYAGKDTYADVSFSWILSDKLAAVLGIIFGTGGILYGRKQAKLRKDVIERMQPFQVEYEKNLDKDRSSSGLTKRGNTRKEDL